jgi:hypothetical protein
MAWIFELVQGRAWLAMYSTHTISLPIQQVQDGGSGTGNARKAKTGETRGHGERAGSDVVSCVEAGRSLLLGRIEPCKKQGLTPDPAGKVPYVSASPSS